MFCLLPDLEGSVCTCQSAGGADIEAQTRETFFRRTLTAIHADAP